MKLWLGRHSFAGATLAKRGDSDKPLQGATDPKGERDRPLTAEGVRMAKAIARAMRDADELPNVIFASPYIRALQTADIYGTILQVRVNIVGDFSPDRPLAKALLGLMAQDAALKRIMVVAHVDNTTPAMEFFGGDVTWDDLVMSEVRRVEIDRDKGSWELQWGIKPSDLGMKDYE